MNSNPENKMYRLKGAAARRVFNHMQRGNSPLTNEEIAKMAEKHPETWKQFIGRGVAKNG
tara:strand:+ start:605 stop:784 length:180 start_codon:yes stop_codon:yes gene_type:complete